MTRPHREWFCFNDPTCTWEKLVKPYDCLGRHLWVTQTIFFGDCTLTPPTSSLDHDTHRHTIDEDTPGLASLQKTTELKDLWLVAKDFDGHRYYWAAPSGEVWVRYHDPDEFENLGVFGTQELLQWFSTNRSRLSEKQNWGIYFTNLTPGAFGQCFLEQRESIDLKIIESSVSNLRSFPCQFSDTKRFSAYDPALGLSIEASFDEECQYGMLEMKLRAPSSVSSEIRHKLERWWDNMKSNVFTIVT